MSLTPHEEVLLVKPAFAQEHNPLTGYGTMEVIQLHEVIRVHILYNSAILHMSFIS